MIKKLRSGLLVIFALLGVLVFSCSKEQDPASTNTTKASQAVNGDLASQMAADPLVQADIRADIRFAADYETWYHGLTDTQKRTRAAEIEAAINSAGDISNPSRTAEETADYFLAQQERGKEIDAKYPQVAELGYAEYADVSARVFKAIQQKAEEQQLGGGCAGGYYACRRYCQNTFGMGTSNYIRCANSCLAGYYACVASSEPAQP